MPRFTHRFTVRADVDAVRDFHDDPSALKRLSPPGTAVRLHAFGPMAEGMVADFTLWLGPLPIRWEAVHRDVSPTGFTDIQRRGPMAAWTHRHRFEPKSDGETDVVDEIQYEHPPGVRGIGTRLLFGRLPLSILFAHRARATRRALEAQ